MAPRANITPSMPVSVRQVQGIFGGVGIAAAQQREWTVPVSDGPGRPSRPGRKTLPGRARVQGQPGRAQVLQGRAQTQISFIPVLPFRRSLKPTRPGAARSMAPAQARALPVSCKKAAPLPVLTTLGTAAHVQVKPDFAGRKARGKFRRNFFQDIGLGSEKLDNQGHIQW